MHRDDPICRARAPLRGLPHILHSLCPEAAEPAEGVIDSCRPRGQQARRGAFWEAGPLERWGLRFWKGKWEVGLLSSA